MADYGLTLGHLISLLETFFHKIGIFDLRFKPAYNPYTEPSMEVTAQCMVGVLGVPNILVHDNLSFLNLSFFNLSFFNLSSFNLSFFLHVLSAARSSVFTRISTVGRRSETRACSGQRCCDRWTCRRACRPLRGACPWSGRP